MKPNQAIFQKVAGSCLYLLLLTPISLSAAPQQDQHSEQDQELQALINELEQQEAFYSELELKLHENYQQPPGNTRPTWKVENETEYSILLQGEKFRQEETTAGNFRLLTQTPRKNQRHFLEGMNTTLTLFDGTTYRRFHEFDHESPRAVGQRNQNKLGEISDLPKRMENYGRPHMLLESSPHVPLSIFLSGKKAMVHFPGLPAHPKPFQVKAWIEGTGEIQGLKCTQVVVERLNDSGVRFSKQILWLAQERNLIPVKIVTYHDQFSREKPCEEAFVDKWQQLGPGVWFPRQAHIDRYNLFLFKYNGSYEIDWRRQYTVQQITLHPKVQKQDFSALMFPQGTTVRSRFNHQQRKYIIGEEKIRPAEKE